MAAIASFQAIAPVCAKRGVGAKSLKAGSSSVMGVSLAPKMPVRTASAATAGALKVEAGFDAGVGVFGNKAGMTQLFTEDGLCVPVTVIAIQAGNVVTQVSEMIRGPITHMYDAGNFFLSRREALLGFFFFFSFMNDEFPADEKTCAYVVFSRRGCMRRRGRHERVYVRVDT